MAVWPGFARSTKVAPAVWTVLLVLTSGVAKAGTTTCEFRVSYPVVIASTTIESLAVVDRADVWAVGYTSDDYSISALIEHWDGAEWSISPTPDLGSSDLADVVALAADDVWAVGAAESNPLALHWDGLAWTQVFVPGFFVALNSVSGVSPTDVWAVGTQSLAVHWDGTLWTQDQVPDVPTLYGISMAASDDVWAVGTKGIDQSQPASAHWDGTSWRSVRMPPGPLHSGQVTGVVAPQSDLAWAVGDDFYGGPPYVFRWNGNRWGLNQPSLDHTYLKDVAGSSSSDVWAVGYFQQLAVFPVAVHWGGDRWHTVPVPDFPEPAEYATVASDPTTNDAWVVGTMSFDPIVVRYVHCSG
jgi:hypothetical protein